MDPLAHTLVGATMAETGLKRKSALGAATLIIGANLPDIDGVATLFGSDASLLHRRGLTHGILAMLLLPLALAGAMVAFDRLWRARRRPESDPRARFLPLLFLSCLSVGSHPFLDWCNRYGVRLLMPFDGTWFYGDSLFIVEPWLWLLGGCAVVLAHSKSKPAIIGWVALLLATTALITTNTRTPPEAKIIWCIGGGLIVYLRMSGNRINIARTAIICLATMALYIGVMMTGTARARTHAAAWLKAQGFQAGSIAPAPTAVRPFHRDVIVRIADSYHFFDVSWWGEGAVHPSGPPIPIGEMSDVVRAAVAAPSVRGLTNWMRFPTYAVESLPDGGHRVTMRDVRYAREQPGGLGTAVVELDAQLQERTP